MSELQLIGQGWTTKVYRDGKKAIKVYIDPPPNEAQNEAKKQEIAYKAQLPVPAVYEVRVIDEHTVALDMEYIEGEMLGDEKTKEEDFPEKIKILVELQIMVHSKKVDGLPSMYDQLNKKINRSKHIDNLQKQKLTALVDETISDSCYLCHGDFHPMNILFDGDKYWIIDWVDATQGNPLSDVCRSYMLFLVQGYTEVAEYYLKSYCQATYIDESEVKVFLPIHSAIRLEENVPDKEKEILKAIITEWDINSKM